MMRVMNLLFAAAAKSRAFLRRFAAAKYHTRPFLSRFTLALNRHRGLRLAFLLAVLLLAGSMLAVSRSTVASWFKAQPPTTRPGDAALRQPVKEKSKVAIPLTHRYSEADQRLLSFAAPMLILGAPTNLHVTEAANQSIKLSWTAPSGSVNHYKVERGGSFAGPFNVIASPSTTTFDDTPPTGIHSYLYRVRAVDSFGFTSSPSNLALGTTISFTDATLQAGVTQIKAQHLYDLRQAVNAVRALVPSMAAASWTKADLYQEIVLANDVQEIRNQLDEALDELEIDTSSYTDNTLATGSSGTLIKKIHIEQLRERSTFGQSTSSGPPDSFVDSASARLDSLNRTGGGGEDPLSRNFNWSIPLVSLPGRAGLDLGLSLSYNSLATWTKSGSIISFDDDFGSPSPGFRLGFPVIQAAHYNTQASKYSFLLLTPSGARVELRQVGTSDLFQAVDSSYLLLDAATMTLRTTDGTQLSYYWMGSDYRCTKIKDRNGNFISVTYDDGLIETVVDTLNRTITFNYDGDDLSSITQAWPGTTHYWARFTYSNTTIQTNFSGLTVYGPANSSTIRTLTRVKFADDTYHDFAYTSWGQVWKISQYTGETTPQLLNYRSYNLPEDASGSQTDCPRFTQRHDWARYWNLDTNGTAQEVTTSFAVPSSVTIPSTSQTGMLTQITQPDGTYQKIYFGSASGSPAWQHGLPLRTDTYEYNNSTAQRSTTTDWTQDDTNVSYQFNPRVTETKVSDPAGNLARTTVAYESTTLSDGTTINLPEDTREYQADGTTQLRRTHVDYNLASEYVSRRIIGLVSEKTLYGGASGSETLMSKVSYLYDQADSVESTVTLTHHENPAYLAGRGNLTKVTRHDVVNTSQSTFSTLKYNTAGAVVSTLDPLSHGVTITYTDQFSANGVDLDSALSFTTLAYPTTVTNAGNFTSSTRYNYAFGGATLKETPLPNVTNDQAGPVQLIEYDTIGRLKKVKNTVNNAYTRYEYGPNYLENFATVNSVADEAHSFQYFDGAGRLIGKASNHPSSSGGFSGLRIVYDQMGRVVKSSNPTETSASGANPYSWTATGDDATAGWLYTQQTYDWKGRPLVTTNTDSTTKTASYGGCGCAGGEVVTLTDEGTIDGGTAKRRQQKVYSDVLGRTVKTEILNWEGGSVYSTTVNTYNVRDQVTLVRQYEGESTSSTYQDTTMSYDGYGRLASKRLPEQSSATSYLYNADDTVLSVTDARGATRTYEYNTRRMPTSATHVLSSQTIAYSYGYDAAGNRISMTDGLGDMSYHYDSLSRMDWEERTITNLGDFKVSYSYNLAGQLASLTEPTAFGQSVTYTNDLAGRLTDVTGTGFSSGTTEFATDIAYRAWGAAGSVNYGSGAVLNVTYNGRLLPTEYELGNVSTSGTSITTMGTDNQYYNDGRIKYAQDIQNGNFDRGYEYDHAGRIKKATSGREARGESPSNPRDNPFNQTFTYDVWNNMARPGNMHWSASLPDNPTYSNNLRSGWTYNANGQVTERDSQTKLYTYDATGQQTQYWEYIHHPGDNWFAETNTIAQTYDGDGRQLKRIETRQVEDAGGTTAPSTTTYYLTSTVLGGATVAEIGTYGEMKKGWVYAGGQKLVEFSPSVYTNWRHVNPVTGSWLTSSVSGSGGYVVRNELDSLGADVGTSDPYISYDYTYADTMGLVSLFEERGSPFDPGGGCGTLDGLPISCSEKQQRMQGGSITQEVRTTDGGVERVPIQDYGLGMFSMFRPNELKRVSPAVFSDVGVAGLGDSVVEPQNSKQTEFTKEQFENFKRCLRDMFQVDYRGHNFKFPGTDSKDDNSYFYGHTKRGASWYSLSAIGDFTVRTDQYTYTVQDIRRKIDPAGVGRAATGLTVGLTDSASPYVNAIANDAGAVVKGSEFFGLWVYELGNALSYITRLTPDIPADARDRYGVGNEAGAAFEDCVFGGRLKSNGLVTPPR